MITDMNIFSIEKPEVEMIMVHLMGDHESSIEIPVKFADYAGDRVVCIAEAKGKRSTVYRMTGTKGTFALKITESEIGSMQHADAVQEIKFLYELQFVSSVINLIDDVEIERGDTAYTYLLEPYLTSLDNYVKEYDIPDLEKFTICRDICEAVMTLFERGIIHLDLKPANIFFDEKHNVVIGDFSSAMFLEELPDQSIMRGTPMFMAPEAYSMGKLSEKSELYSIALMLYWMLNGYKLPFENTDERELAIYKRLAGTVFTVYDRDKLFPTLNFDTHLIPYNSALMRKIVWLIVDACNFDVNERTEKVETLWGQIEDVIDLIRQRYSHEKLEIPVAMRKDYYPGNDSHLALEMSQTLPVIDEEWYDFDDTPGLFD
ncbi:MAG: protein kinase [Mogibacterium sp.]|nr:protein kinase [Mogibacterium sp.]